MKIDHIGIATRQLEEGLAVWRDALGLRIDSTEEIAEQGVRIAMLGVGETHVELLEAGSQREAEAGITFARHIGLGRVIDILTIFGVVLLSVFTILGILSALRILKHDVIRMPSADPRRLHRA